MSKSFELLEEVEPAIPATNDGNPSRSASYKVKAHLDKIYNVEENGTLYHSFWNSVNANGDKPCLGERVIENDGTAGPYKFWTYKETGEKIKQLSSAIKTVDFDKNTKIGIFSANCRQWMLTMQACNYMNYICVPLYDTLGEESIEYIIKHSETSAIFVSSQKIEGLIKKLPSLKEFVKLVVYWGNISDAIKKEIEETNLSVYEFEEFMKIGENNIVEPNIPKPDDLSTIMYTSGTTGVPKGVMLTHSSLSAAIQSSQYYMKQYIPDIGDHAILSFLPLAHILDRVAEEWILSVGSKIGYWRGKITDLMDDIVELKPTLFIGVPRVFDRLYTGVMSKINSASFVKRLLFKYAFNRKAYFLKHGYSHDKASPFFDRLLFKKFNERLGGCTKIILSGGAPIASHTLEFLKVCFCCYVVEGYGLSETCANFTISMPDDPTMDGTVGPPMPFVELKLESVPEMNYDANDSEPAGEILYRSPCNFKGYYKNEEETKKVLEDEGWFHTGDIGKIVEKGTLKIVDRKKNIFKLAQGEYIAIEKIESVYIESAAVENIWVYGDSYKNYLVAVVILTEAYIKNFADEMKLDNNQDIFKNEKLKEDILTEFKTLAHNAKLKGFEMVKAIHFDTEQFSPENGMMTPTFKLKRAELLKKYKDAIDALYSQN